MSLAKIDGVYVADIYREGALVGQISFDDATGDKLTAMRPHELQVWLLEQCRHEGPPKRLTSRDFVFLWESQLREKMSVLSNLHWAE